MDTCITDMMLRQLWKKLAWGFLV